MTEREKTAKRSDMGRESVRRLPVVGSESLPAAQEPTERADAARNRARILTAARHLLQQRAMREICMDELAKEAGVGKGTLYRRFVDRTSLCIALLDENERDLQDALLRSFGLPATAKTSERLACLLHALLEFALDNADLLVEAELSQREPGVLHASPPYAWRRREIVRMLLRIDSETPPISNTRPGAPTLQPETVADVILESMRAELLRTQMARGVDRSTLVAQHEALWSRITGLDRVDATFADARVARTADVGA
ncbi:MAG: helix-turn-helix domain-containing protein [Polyangiaceae bacterium]